MAGLPLHAALTLNAEGEGEEPPYVFDLQLACNSSVLAASLSNNRIKLYSPETGSFLGECCGHRRTISGITFADSTEPHTLFSSAADGSVRAWDVRSREQTGNFISSEARDEFWSVAIGGSTGQCLAAGADEKILLWDRRSARQMACLEEAHTEAVTQVRFHPILRSQLLSASVDGLICSFDTATDLSEDEAMQWVLSVGTSISRIGFYGSRYARLWCTTHIETLSLWELDQGEQIADFPETRAMAAAKWNRGQIDYLIGCTSSQDSEDLRLLAGSNDGTVGAFPVLKASSPPSTKGTVVGPASAVLAGGHAGVVRAVSTAAERGYESWGGEGWLCWTGGEDGRLCAWKAGTPSRKRDRNSGNVLNRQQGVPTRRLGHH